MHINTHRCIQIIHGLLLILAVGGCATAPKTRESIFYPPPPDPPRIQFLTSYSGSADFEPQPGSFYRFIVGALPRHRYIMKPYGVASGKDEILVCDTVIHGLHIFDLEMQELRHFSPKSSGRLGVPINVCVDTDGTRYVADTGRGQIVVFSADGTYRGTIGRSKEFRPSDVAVTRDKVYIADLNAHGVLVYDKATRKRLFAFPHEAEAKDGKLATPTNLAIGSDGHVYVSDTMACRVQRYDAEGKFVQTFGGQGVGASKFARPKGIAVDRNGNLYTADAATQTVQVMNDEGKLLMVLSNQGDSVRFDLLAKVAIDYENVERFRKYADPDFEIEHLIYVTSQYGYSKVYVFGFGHSTAPGENTPNEGAAPPTS